MGVRESGNILGEYELNYQDYKNRRQFPDQIGLHFYPFDFHPYNAPGRVFSKVGAHKDKNGVEMNREFEKGEN